MRFHLAVLLSFLAAPAFAQAPPPAPEIPLDGMWRSDAALNEAEKLMQEKKYVESLTLLDRVILRNIRNADAHVDTAMAWMNLGNIDKARASLNNALSIDKGHLGAYVASGLLALKDKNRQQAEAFLSAIRVLCRGETCPEFQSLQRIIRESKIN